MSDIQPEELLDPVKSPVPSTLDPYGNAIDSERQSLLFDGTSRVSSGPLSLKKWC